MLLWNGEDKEGEKKFDKEKRTVKIRLQKKVGLVIIWKIIDINVHRNCKSCGKEFQNFNQGVVYSSVAKGILDFCSDVCCMNYL